MLVECQPPFPGTGDRAVNNHEVPACGTLSITDMSITCQVVMSAGNKIKDTEADRRGCVVQAGLTERGHLGPGCLGSLKTRILSFPLSILDIFRSQQG